jgi:hypothetical protein
METTLMLVKAYEADISDLKGDPSNANKGTPRGRAALRASLNRLKAGRSVLMDADGHLIAGNKTWEVYGEEGGEKVIIVETDGNTLVAVKRTDLHLGDPQRDELAFADNRVGQLDLDWDSNALAAMADAGVDLSLYMSTDELADMVKRDTEAMAEMAKESATPLEVTEPERIPLSIVLRNSEFKRWANFKNQIGEVDDRKALLALLQHFERHTGI